MSKTMTEEELNNHVNLSIKHLTGLFQNWLKSCNPILLKKARLLAYWIKDYVSFLCKEDAFSPKVVQRLKRGNIVSVDFGFRIGKEFGGRHFAVVIDNENALTSHVVTVIPLFSLKENYKANKYTCQLKDGLYNSMLNRAKQIHSENQNMLTKYLSADKTAMYSNSAPEAKELQDRISRVESMLDELEHMKFGSVANTCQITTISKMRIKRPLSKNDPLYGLRLSSGDMDLINTQIAELYLFKNNK